MPKPSKRKINPNFEFRDSISGRLRTLPARPLKDSKGNVRNPKDIMLRKTPTTKERPKISPNLTYAEAFKILKKAGFKIDKNYLQGETGVKSKFNAGKPTAKLPTGTAINLDKLLKQQIARMQNRKTIFRN